MLKLETLSCSSINKPCCEECHDNVFEGYDLTRKDYEYPALGIRIVVCYCCTCKVSSSEALAEWKRIHPQRFKNYEKRMRLIAEADKVLEE